MASIRRKRTEALASNNDTGFGSNASGYGGRFVNKDGSFNVKIEGASFTQRLSVYHSMLNMPRRKFALAIVLFFVLINILFTCIYVAMGADNFAGFVATTEWGKIKELYFFSTETFTTVGYGRINPVGDGVNLVASFEAMLGFLSFAIATGLIYGRFAKPRAYVVFSEHAVIAPFHDKLGLMFRVAPYKNGHILTDVQIRVTMAMQIEEDGKLTARFYTLTLERNRVDSLMMNWTVVHPLDEDSPLYGYTPDDMKNADVEIYVLLRGFDEVYANTVQRRTSYTFDEIVHNAKFLPMYHESEDGKTTIFELNKLNHYQQL
ncbi:transporter [Ilyomonas limi]|uniref:Transporter n=1 Tax=Ilyomonas limi TaxID=2575867 RepID=A0A4U3L0X2_9BACT|nr:ion channel [Ilyomonas limi]TKK68608.1 transporter [Ilyomonas limi]